MAALVALLAPAAGALWDGARPEVKAFGHDVAVLLLDVVRRALGVPRS
jgi:hypothetical protein